MPIKKTPMHRRLPSPRSMGTGDELGTKTDKKPSSPDRPKQSLAPKIALTLALGLALGLTPLNSSRAEEKRIPTRLLEPFPTSGMESPRKFPASGGRPEKPMAAAEALTKLGPTKKAAILRWYDMKEEEFENLCEHSKDLKATEEGQLFHVCHSEVLPTQQEIAQAQTYTAPESDIPPEQAFELESLPGAKLTIYLDFDGHTFTGNNHWNIMAKKDPVSVPPFTLDADPAFSVAEREAIIQIWKSVAEDFWPFEVNITTKETPLDKLIRWGDNDQEYGQRALIGGDGIEITGTRYGGIAFLATFGWWNPQDTPALIFSDNLRAAKYIAEAVSHELGHTFALNHDGRTASGGPQIGDYATDYHTGTMGWAPIMGVAYYQEVGQWSKGEYPNASNLQDDLAIIGQTLPTKRDISEDPRAQIPVSQIPIGDSGTPTPLPPMVTGAITRPITGHSHLLDLPAAEKVKITTRASEVSSQVAIQLQLKDKYGNLVASGSESLETPILSANRYYLELTGKKMPGATGGGEGSSYGSVGQYRLAVEVGNLRPSVANGKISIVDGYARISDVQASDPEGDAITLQYRWLIGSHPNGAFQELSPNCGDDQCPRDPRLAGNYIKCEVRATDLDEEDPAYWNPISTPWTSPAIRLPALPQNQTYFRKGEQILITPSNTLENQKPTAPVVINEASRGFQEGTNPEWVELLTTGLADLRGWRLQSKSTDILTLSNSDQWASIPEGTLITIYNGLERDSVIPPDCWDIQGERRIVVSSENKTLFQGKWPKISQANAAPYYSANVDTETKTSYGAAPLSLSGHPWLLTEAMIGTDARDMKEGTGAIRVRNGSIETTALLTKGVGRLSFKYARSNFSDDRTGMSPTFSVQIKEDGADWTEVGQGSVTVDTLTEWSATVDSRKPAMIRIKTSSGGTSKRWNVDSIRVTPSDRMNEITLRTKTGVLVSSLQLGDPPTSLRGDFLSANHTEAYLGGAENWANGALWRKTSWTREVAAATPSWENSPENKLWVESLRRLETIQKPVYSLDSALVGLTIDQNTGNVTGPASKIGVHKIRVNVTNGSLTATEEKTIEVSGTFAETFEDNPLVGNNPAADCDGDGLSNLMEFALGSDPTCPGRGQNPNGVATLPDIQLAPAQAVPTGTTQSYLTMTYGKNRLAGGVSIEPEWSTELRSKGSCPWRAVGIINTKIGENGTQEIWEAKIPCGNEKKLYMRLKVSEP
jgi:hypothetical protein